MNLSSVIRVALIAASLAVSGCASSTAHVVPAPRGGERLFLPVDGGRLKARVYSSTELSAHPVLIVVLHGDIPNPELNYIYLYAQMMAEGAGDIDMPPAARLLYRDGIAASDIVAAGMLRPGYDDYERDHSDGDRGAALGDSYTPAVIDAVAQGVAQLRARYAARAVVLVGHSGGAAIAAAAMARHPDLAEAALLIACPCDLLATRAYLREHHPEIDWNHPYRSLSPLDLAGDMPRGAHVRMIGGELDEIVPVDLNTAYADALRARGVDARAAVVPGFDHNRVVFSPAVFNELRALIALAGGAAE